MMTNWGGWCLDLTTANTATAVDGWVSVEFGGRGVAGGALWSTAAATVSHQHQHHTQTPPKESASPSIPWVSRSVVHLSTDCHWRTTSDRGGRVYCSCTSRRKRPSATTSLPVTAAAVLLLPPPVAAALTLCKRCCGNATSGFLMALCVFWSI